MPDAFVVTTAKNLYTLTETRQDKASLTISNTTGRPVRVRLEPVAVGAAKREWITFEGGNHLDLSLGGSQQVTATIAVPTDVAPGTYTLRVDVVAEDQPEEDFAKGPELTIEVPAAPPPAKKFPWWILAVVLAVLVLGAGIVFLLTRSDGQQSPETPTTNSSQPPGASSSTTPTTTLAKGAGTLRASVDSEGRLAAGTAGVGVERRGVGTYEVVFPADVRGCAYLASIGSTRNPAAPKFGFTTVAGGSRPERILVQTLGVRFAQIQVVPGPFVTITLPPIPSGSLGPQDGLAFQVLVACPQSLFAVVRAGGQPARLSPGTSATQVGTGRYQVTFNRDVSKCGPAATIGDAGTAAPPAGSAFVANGPTPQSIIVTTVTETMALTNNLPFHLAMVCDKFRFAVSLNNQPQRGGAGKPNSSQVDIEPKVEECVAIVSPFSPAPAPQGFAAVRKGSGNSVQVEVRGFAGDPPNAAQLGYSVVLACPNDPSP